MKRLIWVEALKLYAYRTFWTCVAGYTVLLFLTSSVVHGIFSRIQLSGIRPDTAGMLTFPYASQLFGFIGGLFYFLLGLVVILLVSNEFENRTIRQHIVEGFSREQYLAGKYLVILFLSAYACAAVFVVSMLFGVALPGTPAISVYTVIFSGLLFLQGAGVLSFALLVSVLAKRAMAATILFLTFPIFIEPFVGLILDAKVMAGMSTFLPFHLFFSYIPSPSFVAPGAPGVPTAETLFAGSAYSVVMVLLTWGIFKQSDI